MNNLYLLFLGIPLLLVGRKLFWLFMAVVGFLAGMHFAREVLHFSSPLITLALSVVVGVVGAVIAVAFYQIAIYLAGFLAAGYFVLHYFPTSDIKWILFFIAGIFGALAMGYIFDWTLIILSSLIGADLVLQGLNLSATTKPILYIVIVVVGIVVQGFWIGSKVTKKN